MIRHPLIQKLADLTAQGRSGCLNVTTGEDQFRIFLSAGFVEAIRGPGKEERLGRLFKDLGVLKERKVKKLVKRGLKTRQALGELAVQGRKVTPCDLVRTVKMQAILRLNRILENGEAGEFEESKPSPGIPCRIRLEDLILELARQLDPPNVELPGKFGLNQEMAVGLEQWAWNPEELAVMGCLLQSPRYLSELRTAIDNATNCMETALGTLLKVGFVECFDPQDSRSEEIPEKRTLREWIPVETPQLLEKLPVLTNRHSFAAEQFKSLKVHLNGAGSDPVPQVVSVSSSFAEDGKSLVSSNLAFACSQDSERRVAVIDCDLRRPKLHDYLGISRGPGLSDYLTDRRFEPYCYLRRFDNLFVITAGRAIEDPVEALSGKRIQRLFDFLRQEFDTILLDCPPLEPISDARIILSKFADGMLLVVRSGRTPYSAAERARRHVDPEKVLGVVLNDVRPLMFNTYYHRNYYYSYKDNGYPYKSD